MRTIQPTAKKPQRCGRFSSPLRRLGRFWFLPFNERHSLSHALVGVTAPSEREPGWGAYHSSSRPKTATLRAIFIAPTKLKRFWFLPFIGRHSLSHALAGVTAPSEREPGGVRTVQRAARKPQGYGRFSSPLRRLGRFWFLPFIERHSLSHAQRACQLPQRGSREGLYRSTCRPETATLRAIFIAPTKAQKPSAPGF